MKKVVTCVQALVFGTSTNMEATKRSLSLVSATLSTRGRNGNFGTTIKESIRTSSITSMVDTIEFFLYKPVNT